MLINPLIGTSVITEMARLALMVSGAISFDFEARTYRLTGLRVADQPIPDIEVRTNTRLKSPDGMLGMSFLQHYREVQYSFTTHQLTLVDP